MMSRRSLIYLMVLIFVLGNSGFSQKQSKNPHLFDVNNWSMIEKCNPCHIYASNLGSNTGSFVFSYDTDSIIPGETGYVSGISKLCCSCHDGTIATYSHNEKNKLHSNKDMRSVYHPVSIQYEYSDTALIKLNNPFLTLSGLGGTIEEDLLRNGKVECTSCHDVHFSTQYVACNTCPENENGRRNLNYASLLISNSSSKLCLTCHKL